MNARRGATRVNRTAFLGHRSHPGPARSQNGSRTATMSPRSTMERRKAVERARGALHNANTGIGATYPWTGRGGRDTGVSGSESPFGV